MSLAGIEKEGGFGTQRDAFFGLALAEWRLVQRSSLASERAQPLEAASRID